MSRVITGASEGSGRDSLRRGWLYLHLPLERGYVEGGRRYYPPAQAEGL